MKADKIYLVGFMCAGKTTVAEILAGRLGWKAKDIDQLIETKEQRSITEIFAQNGESYFRRVEHEILHGLLPRRNVVVATGGGTFADMSNRALISNDGISIWLDISFETVARRLSSDGRRPLGRDRTTMLALWNSRQEAYRIAKLRLEADRPPVKELVEKIINYLES